MKKIIVICMLIALLAAVSCSKKETEKLQAENTAPAEKTVPISTAAADTTIDSVANDISGVDDVANDLGSEGLADVDAGLTDIENI